MKVEYTLHKFQPYQVIIETREEDELFRKMVDNCISNWGDDSFPMLLYTKLDIVKE